jgi:hypothetical protein
MQTPVKGPRIAKFGINWLGVAEAMHVVIAKRRIERMAVAATLFRMKYGAYPATAESMVPEFLPEVPRDPFDNQPLRYVLSNGAATLYSIGRDEIDSTGVTIPGGDDIVFTLNPVPASGTPALTQP